MTTNKRPNFDLIKAIIMLMLVLITVSLILYGLSKHNITASCYGSMFAVLTAVLGKAWTT